MKTEPYPCWECAPGKLQRVHKDFDTFRKGEPITIPNTPMLVCDCCGDEVCDT